MFCCLTSILFLAYQKSFSQKTPSPFIDSQSAIPCFLQFVHRVHWNISLRNKFLVWNVNWHIKEIEYKIQNEICEIQNENENFGNLNSIIAFQVFLQAPLRFSYFLRWDYLFLMLCRLWSEDKTCLCYISKLCAIFIYLQGLFNKESWWIEKPDLRQHKRRRLKRKGTKTNFASYEKLWGPMKFLCCVIEVYSLDREVL